MIFTRNAIGNLINRYKAVLKKCNLLNAFGTLAVAGMLAMGGAGMASATDIHNDDQWNAWINSGKPTDDAKVIGNVTTSTSVNANNKNVAITATAGDVRLTINSTVTNVTTTTVTGSGNGEAILEIRDTLNSATTKANVHSTINLAGTHGGNIVLDGADATLFGQDGRIVGNLDVHDGAVGYPCNFLAVDGKTTLDGGSISTSSLVVDRMPTRQLPVLRPSLYTNGLDIKGGKFTVDGSTYIHDGKTLNVSGGNVELKQLIFFYGSGKLQTSINLVVDELWDMNTNDGAVVVQGGSTLTASRIGFPSLGKVDASDGNVVSNGHLNTKELLIGTNKAVKANGNIEVKDTISTFGDGGSLISYNGNITLTGGVTGGKGTVQANNGSVTVGTTNSPELMINAGKVTFTGGNNTVKVVDAIDTVNVTAGTLNVLNELRADKVAVKGGSSIIATELHAFRHGTTVEGGSSLAVTSADDNSFDGTLTVGNAADTAMSYAAIANPSIGTPADARSMKVEDGVSVLPHGAVALGTTNVAAATDAMARAKAAGTGATAFLYLDKQVDAGSKLGVGTVASATEGIKIGNKAAISINAANAPSLDPAGNPVAAYIKLAASDATPDAIKKAALDLQAAEYGQVIKVFENSGSLAGDQFTGGITTDNRLLNAAVDAASGNVKVGQNEATDLMPNLDSGLGSVFDDAVRNDIIGTDPDQLDSHDGGVKFLSRVISREFAGNDIEEATKIVEGASRMVATSAPQMAAAASNAGVSAVIARTSICNLNSSLMAMDSYGNVSGMNAGDDSKTGVGLWIMPLWQNTNVWGMKAGEFKSDMHGNIGGVAIGADYTFENALRAGITFNIGGGYAEGSGDFAKTTNNMNFWGIGLYGSWAYNNFGVTADVNYTSTFNKMKQELDSSMGMADLKSDVYSSAITAGLRGEYKFVTDALDITPHLGVRLMYLHTDEYDVKSAGSKVYKGDAINQTIWSFPVGVQFSKSIELNNGWYVKPSLDLQVTPRAGEVHAKNDIKYTGLNTSASIETQTMDYITYGGAAGIEFGNDNVKLGLNYNLEAGAHTTNHGVFGTFRYEF